MIFSDKFLDNKTKLVLALILPAILLYYKSTKYEFTTLDEQWLIVQNADLLQGLKALKDGFTRSLFGLYYRPLLITSIFIDFKMGSVSPYIYHLTNLLLHLTSVLLLYKFLRLNKASKQIAFVCSLVFSVHPILLHAVAWVPGRNDSLLFIFTLASFICLLEFLAGQKNKFIIFHYLFFICALLTKETAFVLPLIFIVIYFIHKKFKAKEFGFLFLGWLILILTWLFLRNKIVEVPAPDSLGMFEVIKNFVPAMLLYTGKAIIPVNQSILPLMRNSTIIPGLIAVVLLVGLWFRPGVKDKKIAVLGLVMFFAILALPVWFSASKTGAEHYEHRLYTAMAGMILFFSQLKFERYPKMSRYLVVLVFLIFFIKTFLRMDVYKNKENFVNAGVKECQGNYIFLLQKSEVLFNQKDFAGALDYCNQAIAIRPDKTTLYGSRGTIYYQLGFYKSAVSDFSSAIRLSPKMDPKMHLSRAVSYEKAGDIRNAVKDLMVLKNCCQGVIPPDVERVITEKWNVMVNDLNKKITEGTADANDYYQRAQFYFDMNQEKEGLADLSKACALDPENKEYLKEYMEHYEKLPK